MTLNQNEDYFKVTKDGHTHILSDRIAIKWKELLILPILIFVPMLYWVGWFPGLVVGILTGVGYAIYRFAASIKYKEVHINEQSGTMLLLNKLKDSVTNEEVITDKYNPKNLEFIEMTRSGSTKFLMQYKTHRDTNLLIIKTIKDKQFIEDYFINIITINNEH